METVTEILRRPLKNWWIQLLLGIFFIVVGFWTMVTPLESYVTLSILFSVLMFISGIFELVFGISNIKKVEGWGWYLAAGIIDFIIGLGLIAYPQISIAILPFFVAFWIMFKSFSAIGGAIEFRRWRVKYWWLMLIFGILGIIFTFMIIDNPLIGGLSIVLLTSYAFWSIGIFKIVLAFRLKNMHKRLKESGM